MSIKKFITIRELLTRSDAVIDESILESSGSRGKIEIVDPNDLAIDYTFQRDLNMPHAMDIAQNFRYSHAKVPSGFRIPETGQILITDGQHTAAGAARRGITALHIYVFDCEPGETYDDILFKMTEQFDAINGRQKKMDGFTKHKTALILKKPDALKVQAVADASKVTYIPQSAKKKKTPGSMSHMEIANKMITQIGEKSAQQAYEFHRKYWPLEPIEPNIVWGLARFYKQFDIYRSENEPGAMFEEMLIYKSLTADGRRLLSEVKGYLDNFFILTGARNANNGDIFRAKEIRIAYNNYVTKHQLGVDKLLDEKIY